jgi:predicted RNA polymerase sigma factor
MARDLHRSIDAVWRIESAKIIGVVARMVRDVGLAEELAQDALVAPRWSIGQRMASATTRVPG